MTGTITPVDLSHKGVDNILAALANAGLEVHYNETDGDTFIDIWLTDLDDTTATILSWRDNGEGWLLRTWDKFGGDTNNQQPDRKWPFTAGSAAEVARDVAAILADDEPDTTPAAEPTLRQKLAAELHRIAGDLIRLDLPVGAFASLRFGVVDSRADLDPWAEYLGTTINTPDGIPFVEKSIPIGGYYSELTIGVQSPREESEAEQLRARVAELEAQIAAGGAR